MNKSVRLKVNVNDNSPVIDFKEKEKRRILKLTSNNFNIEFLGTDKKGKEIYQGDKDSWKNLIEYLFNIYSKHFSVVDEENDLIFNGKDMKDMVEDKVDTEAANTVALKTSDYDVMKKKADAFDKLIEIVCRDGVKFHQEWNKEDVRKVCKGGSVKVGEIVGKWHGEIRFDGNEKGSGQKDFGDFVNAMIDGMDEEMRGKILVGE